jgi:cysteine desulfurase
VTAPVIYLDHNATTPPRPEVNEEIARVSRDAFGNPGSRHAAGRAARKVLESSRERLAATLGANPSEVIFTSGGTESINLAIRGLAGAAPGALCAPAGEHPATEQSLAAMVDAGWERFELPLNSDGLLFVGACTGNGDVGWAVPTTMVGTAQPTGSVVGAAHLRA